MKGAMADPLDKTIRTPNNRSTNMSGNSQNFFLTLRNDHKSVIKSIIAKFLVRGFQIIRSVRMVTLN